MHLSTPSLESSPTFVDDMWFKYILSVISATIAEGGKRKCLCPSYSILHTINIFLIFDNSNISFGFDKNQASNPG